jgi:uncharacterized membrane protein (GlpM family)
MVNFISGEAQFKATMVALKILNGAKQGGLRFTVHFSIETSASYYTLLVSSYYVPHTVLFLCCS